MGDLHTSLSLFHTRARKKKKKTVRKNNTSLQILNVYMKLLITGIIFHFDHILYNPTPALTGMNMANFIEIWISSVKFFFSL